MSHTLVTANLGLVVPTTGAPDYGGGATDFAQICEALEAIDAAWPPSVAHTPQHITAAGAIAVQDGKVFLQTGAASALTLANPTAGSPGAGGQDGVKLEIIAIDAYAYVLTTASDKINGADDTATWAAAVGNSIVLVAFNGVWYVEGTPKGVTLSAV